jgi:hypothetical protein
MPALAKAFWIASKVLVRESTIPFSSLATAFSDTIALSAADSARFVRQLLLGPVQ